MNTQEKEDSKRKKLSIPSKEIRRRRCWRGKGFGLVELNMPVGHPD